MILAYEASKQLHNHTSSYSPFKADRPHWHTHLPIHLLGHTSPYSAFEPDDYIDTSLYTRLSERHYHTSSYSTFITTLTRLYNGHSSLKSTTLSYVFILGIHARRSHKHTSLYLAFKPDELHWHKSLYSPSNYTTHLLTCHSGQTTYINTRLHTRHSCQANYINTRLQGRHTQTTHGITNTLINHTNNGWTPPYEPHYHSSRRRSHELYDTIPNSCIKHTPLMAFIHTSIGVLHEIPPLHKSLLPMGRKDIDLLKIAVGV